MKLFKFIPILMIFFFWSCQHEADQLSDEQISINLSIGGEINPELLIGEWDCSKFAYTADGIKISNVAAVSSGFLTIPTTSTPIDDDGAGRWGLSVINSMGFIYSLEGNRIELKQRGSTYIYVFSPHEEFDLISALNNAYSFVIKGNELMIHFQKVEDKEELSYCTVIKDKNLLILKKR